MPFDIAIAEKSPQQQFEGNTTMILTSDRSVLEWISQSQCQNSQPLMKASPASMSAFLTLMSAFSNLHFLEPSGVT
jgi:hypothetical protein